MKTRLWISIALLASSASLFGADKPDLTPAVFISEATQDRLTGAALGKLALSKSASPEVLDFARRTIAFQDRLGPEISAIARANGVVPPARLDSNHQALVMALDTEEGASFDHVYARQMSERHERAVELFEGAAKSTDADLAEFAQQILPVLKEDAALAKKLAKKSR
jgi:putative membrane protein